MASLATTLGLRASASPNLTIPVFAPTYLTVNFILAYVVLAPRHLKQYYGLDHQASPREDLAKFGDEAVRSGKISQSTLNMMKRNESAQANAIENYVLFVGAMGFATFAGVERELVNRAGLMYTSARIVYGALYILVEDPFWSLFRTVAWWAGNGTCLWLLSKAGKKLNLM
jgi:uncharacterized MAPEG superfamily protein